MITIDLFNKITLDQRKKIYATLTDISAYLGYEPKQMKELLKYWHIHKTGCDYFSLSDCSDNTAKEFINTLIQWCVEWHIPLSDSHLNRTDDMHSFLLLSNKYRICSICGKHARRYSHGKEELIFNLCESHYREIVIIGLLNFEKKYKVYGIKRKYLDHETK